jgi:adhesin transport system outer membrane protein
MKFAKPRLLRLCAVLVAFGTLTPAFGRCIDEEINSAVPREPGSGRSTSNALAPREAMQNMVQEAMRRSHAIGAARLLAEAAESDIGEAKAQRMPQASLTAGIGAAGSEAPGIEETRGKQGRVTLGVNAPLFDFGRISSLTDWRSSLAESARQGQLTAKEQVALQTVSLAVERSRYRLQAQVYEQYARKMSCLVEALETIVRSDKGRASELVQASKTLQQAEISQAQTLSTVKQIETRLSRFVGPDLPNTDGMASLLLSMPALEDALADAERASDIAQLTAQAEAMENYSKSVVAGQRPQVGWSVSTSKITGAGASTSWGAGVNINVPLYNAGNDPAATSARKRAEAARFQRAEAVESRKFRMAEVYEQGISSFDRARRVINVLRDSDRVRNYTLQQWQQLGRRSLFDVMASESEHYSLRVAYVNALYDGQQANALLRSLGTGVRVWLE